MKISAFKTPLSRISLITILLATLCFTEPLPLVHAQNLPTLGDASSEDLSPNMERKLGEEIMLGIRSNRDYIDDEVSAEYLNDFGSKLLELHHEARGEANFDFYFFAVRDPRINAFALPGGFIGVHSELILTAQNESQLASVLAHEIGHVAQRHIARMIGNQKQDALIPLTSLILAALTMHASPDAAMGLASGGLGLAAQRQLNFSQNAEREADRVGLQILRDGGYDPSDMVAFFERMQNSSRSYSDQIPAFLRSHPMTTERIADIQSRIRSDTFKKHHDSLDFQLFRSRIRVLQDESTQSLLNAKNYFEDQIKQATVLKKTNAAAKYGLAFVAFKQMHFKEAQTYLDKARKEVENNLFFTSLQLTILLRTNQNEAALKQAEIALQQFPTSRGIGRQYVDALIANNQGEKAIAWLRDQTLLYREDFGLQKLLAKAYAAENKEALEHIALAESYALSGAISPALDQLSIARNANDATFFDLAIIDARERDLRERYKEELEELKKKNEKAEFRS
jgi:predicted Zn-dependent protease